MASKFPSLERLEIPDCDCVMPKVKACVFFFPDGCPQKEEMNRCDHPFFTEPCVHILHAEDPFYTTSWAQQFYADEDDQDGLYEEWIKNLWAAYPNYRLPRRIPKASVDSKLPDYEKPMEVLEREARVAVMRLRNRNRMHIWHAGDVVLDGLARSAPLIDTYANGTFLDNGIATIDQFEEDDPTKDQAWFAEWETKWYEFVRSRFASLREEVPCNKAS